MFEALKRQTWIQPFMPQLRLIRREFDNLRYLPESWPAEQASRSWLRHNSPQASAIEDALTEVRQQGGYFSGWALSRNALRSFSAPLLAKNKEPVIVEFGSGQSTLFWHILQRQLRFQFTSFEHSTFWHEQLSHKFHGKPEFRYLLRPLKQLSDDERNSLWQAPQQAHQRFLTLGKDVPAENAEDMRLRNCFYTIDAAALFTPASIDGLILDGPNGNGRSIAFPLLFPFLKPDAWILVDDYDHYPFLRDLRQLRPFVNRQIQIGAGKRWCLIQLQG